MYNASNAASAVVNKETSIDGRGNRNKTYVVAGNILFVFILLYCIVLDFKARAGSHAYPATSRPIDDE